MTSAVPASTSTAVAATSGVVWLAPVRGKVDGVTAVGAGVVVSSAEGSTLSILHGRSDPGREMMPTVVVVVRGGGFVGGDVVVEVLGSTVVDVVVVEVVCSSSVVEVVGSSVVDVA